MAETKLGVKIPQQSIMYIGICLIGILLFVFVGIIPANKSLANLDKQTEEVKYRIQEQQALAPFYQSIKSKGEKKASESLPLPEKGKLAQSRIDTIPVTFGTAAQMSGLSLVSATPDMNTLAGNASSLSVNVVLRGDFIKFRKFLINIGNIPYVQHIEEISIQEIPGTREFRLKIWLAVG